MQSKENYTAEKDDALALLAAMSDEKGPPNLTDEANQLKMPTYTPDQIMNGSEFDAAAREMLMTGSPGFVENNVLGNTFKDQPQLETNESYATTQIQQQMYQKEN